MRISVTNASQGHCLQATASRSLVATPARNSFSAKGLTSERLGWCRLCRWTSPARWHLPAV
eukprot:243157-Alexandrium_andersonii.AAC.1